MQMPNKLVLHLAGGTSSINRIWSLWFYSWGTLAIHSEKHISHRDANRTAKLE